MFVDETYCLTSPIFCALSMAALSGTSTTPMYWSMLAAAITDIVAHTTDQNHSRPSCGSSTNHLNVRCRDRGSAVAVQMTATTTIRYEPPMRRLVIPISARTAATSLSFIIDPFTKDYFR